MSYKPQTAAPHGLVPSGVYQIHVKDVNNTPSRESGNPMSRVDFEVVSPASAVDLTTGATAKTAGINGTTYFIYKSAKTDNIDNARRKFESLGMPPITDAADEAAYIAKLQAFLSGLKGWTFKANLRSRQRIARNPPKAGEREGTPVLDDSGKQIVTGYELRFDLDDIIPGKAVNIGGPITEDTAAVSAGSSADV